MSFKSELNSAVFRDGQAIRPWTFAGGASCLTIRSFDVADRRPRRLGKIGAVLAMLLMIFGLSGCGDQEWRWHQKLTMTIDTPSGQKSASSVHEGVAMKYGWWRRQWSYGGGTALLGEAVVLEVAPGRYLFALLKDTPLAWRVFLPQTKDIAEAGGALEKLRASRLLRPDQYPLLVTFGDINNPASVKRVDPANLAATFGSGYKLNSITMTVTDEAVTEGRVRPLLSWWKHYTDKNNRMKSLRYPNTNPRRYDTLTPLDFWSLNNIPT